MAGPDDGCPNDVAGPDDGWPKDVAGPEDGCPNDAGGLNIENPPPVTWPNGFLLPCAGAKDPNPPGFLISPGSKSSSSVGFDFDGSMLGHFDSGLNEEADILTRGSSGGGCGFTNGLSGSASLGGSVCGGGKGGGGKGGAKELNEGGIDIPAGIDIPKHILSIHRSAGIKLKTNLQTFLARREALAGVCWLKVKRDYDYEEVLFLIARS